jgi:glycosyltransferase involved in cell wall biosynthesis
MEAVTAAKPIITTKDSGGILGLAKHRETGWVTLPTPQELATAMDESFSKPVIARGYGSDACDLWRSMGVTWPRTVETLLQ